MESVVNPHFKLIIEDTEIGAAELPQWATEQNTDSPSDWIKALASFLVNWFSESDHIPVQTSGSTGKPKTILLEKQKMVASAKKTNAFFDLKAGDTVLLPLSVDYIAGKMMLLRSLVGGMILEVIAPTSTPFANTDKRYNFSPFVPMQVQASLDKIDRQLDTVLIGGAPVDYKLEQELQKFQNCQAFQSFGMTETISHIAVKAINGTEKSEVYTCLQGVTVNQTETGQLTISAPHLVDETLITNDLVKLIDSTHFEWLGRTDFVINSGGVKIHPEKVERKLQPFISERFIISSIPHEKLGHQVVLIIETSDWNSSIEESLKENLQVVLERFEIPKSIFTLPQFVYTETQKVKRGETTGLVEY